MGLSICKYCYEDYQEDLGDNFNPVFVDTVDVDVSNRDYTKTIKTTLSKHW